MESDIERGNRLFDRIREADAQIVMLSNDDWTFMTLMLREQDLAVDAVGEYLKVPTKNGPTIVRPATPRKHKNEFADLRNEQ